MTKVWRRYDEILEGYDEGFRGSYLTTNEPEHFRHRDLPTAKNSWQWEPHDNEKLPTWEPPDNEKLPTARSLPTVGLPQRMKSSWQWDAPDSEKLRVPTVRDQDHTFGVWGIILPYTKHYLYRIICTVTSSYLRHTFVIPSSYLRHTSTHNTCITVRNASAVLYLVTSL